MGCCHFEPLVPMGSCDLRPLRPDEERCYRSRVDQARDFAKCLQDLLINVQLFERPLPLITAQLLRSALAVLRAARLLQAQPSSAGLY